MSLNLEQGTITSVIYASNGKTEVEWKIPDFFRTTFGDKSWDSPPFLFLNAMWCLTLNLNIDGDTQFWKGLYLVVPNPTTWYSVTFTFSIRGLAVPCQFGPEARIFDKDSASHGKMKFFQINNLKRVNTHSDTLVIHCNVAVNPTSTACQKHLLHSTATLCRDFLDLLLSGRNSDLTITVRNQKFKVHKTILQARSPVFAAMFDHDMTEKEENVVKVEDCDPDTFQNFLKGVYVGSVDNLTAAKAISLYMVAHKYAVTDIMGKCVQLMEGKISEEIVCDILTLANIYSETDLKILAENFVVKNTNEIISTQNWSSLMVENSLLQKYK